VHISDVNKIPLFLTFNPKKIVKKDLAIDSLARSNDIEIINETLYKLKKTLLTQQRSSANKTCDIDVSCHYEMIWAPDLSCRRNYAWLGCNENKSYRLKKIEFRRVSALHHKSATIPMPILNFNSIKSIAHNKYLGEIELNYDNESALSPTKIRRQFSMLY